MHTFLALTLGYIVARKFFLYDDEPTKPKEVDDFVPSKNQLAIIDHWADECDREDKRQAA
ncbi:hypothetical protein [Loigolactobacillus backii]|uniref:hypothetical protein n=1 Tax=Loigolactobacillus backii TaxID=375175 RepID=UPI0007F160BF|nr:hypothetical protein [Loigolactobacillus backii]ANK59850.1 hypothetical protein AYR52_05990 [Loigolactobacillus backii]